VGSFQVLYTETTAYLMSSTLSNSMTL
jgi:hypothetical protein